MAQIKKERLQSIILKSISTTLNMEVRDPDIAFCTVTEVQLTNDYSIARVFVTFLTKNGNDEKRLAALNRCKGLIRSHLAKDLSIRKTPQLIFALDKSLEQGNRIEQIIKDLDLPQENEEKEQ